MQMNNQSIAELLLVHKKGSHPTGWLPLQICTKITNFEDVYTCGFPDISVKKSGV